MPDHHSAQPVPVAMSARDQVIAGLRQLAGYPEQHPGVPVNLHGWQLGVYDLHHEDRDGMAEVDRVAAHPRHRRHRPDRHGRPVLRVPAVRAGRL
jgi:hypothetical protein